MSVIACVMLSVLPCPATAFNDGFFKDKFKNIFKGKEKKEKKKFPIPQLQQNTLQQNIATPNEGKVIKVLSSHMARENRRLSAFAPAYSSLVRNGDVIKYTIPSSLLFNPNDTVFSLRAEKYLRPLLRYFANPGYYYILIASYSDNTGCEEYLLDLCDKRSQLVLEWFMGHGAKEEFMARYAEGSSGALVENNSDMNREKNRRIEIYILPGAAMIYDAQKGKIEKYY